MKKYIIKLCTFISFVFLLFIFCPGFADASNSINYETYILKYDINYDSDINADCKNKTYTLNVNASTNSIDYVAYEIYVKNIGTESLTYNYGTYQIIGGVASEYKIRFEDTLGSNRTTSFVIRNYDINTIEEFMFSLVSKDFYQSMVASINGYLSSNLEFSYLSTDSSSPHSGYEDIYSDGSLKYTFYDSEGNYLSDKYNLYSLPSFAYTPSVSYDIENVFLTRLSDFYTVEDLEQEYLKGFADGESSVDITSDNDLAIELHFKLNNYYTESEYIEHGNSNYEAGKNHVYSNIENDDVVKEYVDNYVTDYIVENKYVTEKEYIDNYDKGYEDGVKSVDTLSFYDNGYAKGLKDGKEVVYENIDSDPVIQEVWKEKIIKDTTISIKSEGNKSVELVKQYDVTINDSGDFGILIDIKKGQDSYHVETVKEVVPGVSTNVTSIMFDYELLYQSIIVIVVACLCIISFIILISVLFNSSNRKAGKKYGWGF